MEEKESWKSSFKWKWKKWGGGSEGSEPRNVFMKDSVLCLSKYSAGRLYTKGRAQEISLCWPKNFAQLLPQVTTPSGDKCLQETTLSGDCVLKRPHPLVTMPSGDHSLEQPLPQATILLWDHILWCPCPQVITLSGDHSLRRPCPPGDCIFWWLGPSGDHTLWWPRPRRPHPLVTTPSGDHTLRWPPPSEYYWLSSSILESPQPCL